MLKVIGARCLCNNTDAFPIAVPWLSLETLNRDKLFHHLPNFGSFGTGISARALNFQLRWKDQGEPDGIQWAAVCFLDRCVVPQLREGSCSVVWERAIPVLHMVQMKQCRMCCVVL